MLDWDGNLIQTLQVWLEACRAPLEKRGVKLTDEEVAASFGQFPAHIKKWGLEAETDAIWEEADKIAKAKLPEAYLYPDALDVLQELKSRNKKLALVTTSLREHLLSALDRHGMSQLFDAIVTGDDVANHKPHSEPIDKALGLLGGDNATVVMVGDSDKDLGAAQNAGVDSILFFPPEHSNFYSIEELRKHNPTHIISDFRKMLDIV